MMDKDSSQLLFLSIGLSALFVGMGTYLRDPAWFFTGVLTAALAPSYILNDIKFRKLQAKFIAECSKALSEVDIVEGKSCYGFFNGQHVHLAYVQRSKHPDCIAITVKADPRDKLVIVDSPLKGQLFSSKIEIGRRSVHVTDVDAFKKYFGGSSEAATLLDELLSNGEGEIRLETALLSCPRFKGGLCSTIQVDLFASSSGEEMVGRVLAQVNALTRLEAQIKC
jgi:hypothetical protein